MQAPAAQDVNRVFEFRDRDLKQVHRVVQKLRVSSSSFDLYGRPDVLERVDDPEERSDRRDLSGLEIYLNICRAAEARRVVELVAVVKVYSLLDRVDHAAMEERSRVGGLDQDRRVECAVPDAENTGGWSACAEASISRILLSRDD